MFRSDSKGTVAIIGFMVGGILFFATFYYVVETAVKASNDMGAADEASYSAVSKSLSDVLFARGSGWYTSVSCLPHGKPDPALFDAEGVGEKDGQGNPLGRMGLGIETCGLSLTDAASVQNLSYEKFANLYRAELLRDPSNGYVDYEEARDSLDLDGRGIGFHVRSWPVLASTQQLLRSGFKDPYLRPMYLGNYVEGAGAPARPLITVQAEVREDSDAAYVDLTILNNGIPTVPSQFQAVLSIPLDKGTVSWTQNFFEIPPLGSSLVTSRIPKTKDWVWDDDNQKKVAWSVSDSLGPLASGDVSLAAFNMAAPSDTANHVLGFVSLDRLVYTEPFGGSNKWPEATYVGYNGKGQSEATYDGDDVDVRVIEQGGLYTRIFGDPDENAQTLEDGLLDVGLYRVELWAPAALTGTLLNSDLLQILNPLATQGCNGINPGDYVPASSALAESNYVDLLFESFDRYAEDDRFADPPELDYLEVGGVSVGDVYPDIKCAMNTDLPQALTDAAGNPTLARYTTLMVGSDVDHNAMTSAAAKNTIRDWVLAGGTLIVFGSSDQSVSWLQPLFHTAIDSAGGGLFTPDAEHPVLRVPNDLDYAQYEYSTQWDYNSGADTKFTHVVTTGGTSDILGVSDPGAFGSGRVLLTSWRPFELTSDQTTTCSEPLEADDPCQALFLIHNLVTISYRELYLDYGPPLPLDQTIGAQLRIASVYHPELKQLVPLQIQVFAFPG